MSVLTNNRTSSNDQQGSSHQVTVVTKYSRRPDDSGWLRVRLEPSGDDAYLCEFTKVTLLREKGGRTYFKVGDGNSSHVGEEASMGTQNAEKYLSSVAPKAPAIVKVKYSGSPVSVRSEIRGDTNKQQWAIASFDGKTARVTLNSVWGGQYTPLPPGTHRIMAPDQSHANISTAGYKAAHPGKVRCNDVWFPIEVEGTTGNSSRYVHIGHLSEGCVTFYELLKWNDIYDYLIDKRTKEGKGKYIGTLVVEK
jgi:hypothetical protein